MRLFVAFEIPNETRAALAQLMARLKPKCPAAKWVRPEGMHVTLKFIGHVADDRLGAIRDRLTAVRDDHPVEMRFRGLGFFPNDRRPRVLWCGVEASANAATLAAAIDHSLAELGIELEARPFTPHLTLARFNSHELHQRGKRPPGLDEVIAIAHEAASQEFGGLHTCEFHLFESKLSPSGAQYSVIETFQFAKASP